MKIFRIKQKKLKTNYIKIAKAKLLVYCMLPFVASMYCGCISAQLLGTHRNTDNKLTIRYNAQDRFSVPEIHRILIENAHHKNLHMEVYAWSCEEKVDKEYRFDIFYFKDKIRDVKQCNSRMNLISQRLRNIEKLVQRHRRWKTRLDRLNQDVKSGRRLLIQDKTTYHHLREMQEVIDIENLETAIPTWRNLNKETKDFLVKLKVRFSLAQKNSLRMSKVIRNIESQIESIRKSSQSESETGQQAIGFFQDIVIALKKIESRKKQTKKEVREELSSFFKNHEITAMEEQDKLIRDLAILIEAYTEITEINHFINEWGKNVLSFLSNEMQDITLLNSNEKDKLVQALQQLLNSMNHLRNLTSFLDLQFLEFTGLFIPQVIFPKKGRDIFDLSEEEKHQFTETSRQAIYDNHIPVYVSKWFKDYYVSYNYERVNTFLSYAESVQKYLQTMKDQILSRYKEKTIEKFIEEVEQSFSSVQMTPPVQALINDMLSDLSAIVFLHQEIENNLLTGIESVSELFSNLSDAVDNKYYGSPFHVLIEYIKSRNEETQKSTLILKERITETGEEITIANKDITTIRNRIFSEWKLNRVWLSSLENTPGFYLTYTIHYLTDGLNEERWIYERDR